MLDGLDGLVNSVNHSTKHSTILVRDMLAISDVRLRGFERGVRCIVHYMKVLWDAALGFVRLNSIQDLSSPQKRGENSCFIELCLTIPWVNMSNPSGGHAHLWSAPIGQIQGT
jgi:hypothetical protein